MSEIFKFKKFSVKQSGSAMKIGTDAVLLGSMVELNNPQRVLDIGSGTGVISLMIAQRCNASIVGIELDKEAAAECEGNYEESPWSDRLKVINQDVKLYNPKEKFDLIVSNPPYFPIQTPTSNKKRTSARQQVDLSLETLADISNQLLHEKGIFALILPHSMCSSFINSCNSKNLYCNRFVTIHGTINSLPSRGMLEFSRLNEECKFEELTIELEKRHQYSSAYLNLLRDFLFLE